MLRKTKFNAFLFVIAPFVVILMLAFQSALEPRIGSLELTVQAHDERLKDLEIVTGLLTPITPTIEFRTTITPTFMPTATEIPYARCVMVLPIRGLNIRTTAVIPSQIIGRLKFGEEITIYVDDYLRDYRDNLNQKWALIYFDGKEGYIVIEDGKGNPYVREC